MVFVTGDIVDKCTSLNARGQPEHSGQYLEYVALRESLIIENDTKIADVSSNMCSPARS